MRRRTKGALAVAIVALVVLVGAAGLFLFVSDMGCGLGNAQVYIVHHTSGEVQGPSDARLAIHQAYEADGNDTDRPFAIRDVGPNRSEFNRSYAHRAPLGDDVKEGVPARSGRIAEDEAFYLFYGNGRNSIGATEEGDVFVLTRGIC